MTIVFLLLGLVANGIGAYGNTTTTSQANGTTQVTIKHFSLIDDSISNATLMSNETNNSSALIANSESYYSSDTFAQEYAAWMESVIAYRWSDKYNVAWWIGVIPALASVASVGNILVLIVASISRQFRTVSCIFLTNLSAIDAFQTIVIVPFRVLETFVIKFPFDEFWICKFIYVMREALYICYVQTFILIAIERYIVVVYPMKALHLCTKKRARLSLLAAWMLSLILAFPNWFQTSLVGVEEKWPICVRDIIRRNYHGVDVELWRRLHESYSLFLLYVLPLTALIICYSVIAVALYQSIQSAHQLTKRSSTQQVKKCTVRNSDGSSSSVKSPPDIQRERILVLRMCVVLVSFFGICQGPWRIHYWLNVLQPDLIPPAINSKLQAPFFALCVLNSAVNPFIYGFMSRQFRQAFVLTIAKWCMVPIEVYHRSIKNWQEKHSDRKKKRRMQAMTLPAHRVSEVSATSVPSYGSRRASTAQLVCASTHQVFSPAVHPPHVYQKRTARSLSISDGDNSSSQQVPQVVVVLPPLEPPVISSPLQRRVKIATTSILAFEDLSKATKNGAATQEIEE